MTTPRKPGRPRKPTGTQRVRRMVMVSPETEKALLELPAGIHGGTVLDMAQASGLLDELKTKALNTKTE